MPFLLMPNVGEGVTQGTVVGWLKQEGDHVRTDEPLVEVETDKAVVEVPSPYDGVLVHILVPDGATAKIGAPLAEFDVDLGAATSATLATTTQPAAVERAAASAPLPPPVGTTPDHPPPALSPVVLSLAAEHGIDLSAMRGTGTNGRVTRIDVMRYLAARGPAAATVLPVPDVAAAAPVPSATTAAAATGDDALVPLSTLRQLIAARMSESHQTIPVAWMAIEADVTGLVALRAQMRDAFRQREGINLTFLPFLVEAIVATLKAHPALNASFSDEGITYHRGFHIGIAVSTPAGLMVPVIRDADRQSIEELAHTIATLAERARTRRIARDELLGATFTINNTGAFGSVISQPIILPGQVAIITTEAIRRVLRVMQDDAFAVRSVMNLAISFDHRALDGADVGGFMQAVRERIEAIGPRTA